MYFFLADLFCDNFCQTPKEKWADMIGQFTGRIQFKVLPSCLAKSFDFGSALLKYYVNVQVFIFQQN